MEKLTQAEIELFRQIRKTVGKNIHEARRKRKVTLKRLSRYTGLREATIDQYELGKKQIGFNELVVIATALKVQLTTLVE